MDGNGAGTGLDGADDGVSMTIPPAGRFFLCRGRFVAWGAVGGATPGGPGRSGSWHGAGRFLHAGQQYLLLSVVHVDEFTGMSRDPFD